ncbi:MAG: PPC domain-containing protein, partial [Proteobacteria bacterium]|nr:PPC domain-containing protein [Pseudomonadota bacterium]
VTSTNSTTPSFETFESKYGAEVQVNPNPKIKGSLSSTDFLFAENFLDLYQFDVVNTTNLQFDLSSTQFDTYLRVVEILPDQSLGSLVLENDDRSESSTDSRIRQLLSPGTYWIGVSSFFADETGDYSLDITVIIP